MLIRYVTLWPWPMKVRRSSSVTCLSEIQQSAAELLIILGIFAHVMSRCDLDVWPFDLELLKHYGCHAFKLCLKFERNRIIHRWLINDLARLYCAILGGGAQLTNGRNLTKLGKDIGWSFLHTKFVSAFRYLVAFSNTSGSKLSDIENDAKFRIFDPCCEN